MPEGTEDFTASGDASLAAQLADQAGRALLELRASGLRAKALGRAGDQMAHDLLLGLLNRYRPADAVLSEEAADSGQRLEAKRVWIIDPLDGTREYGEPGRSDWAVHVALWERGDLAAGAVALPARGLLLRTDRPPALPPLGHPVRLVVSRSRPPTWVPHVAELLEAEVHPLGSAGAKTAAVVLGEADLYLHAGGQYEWDSAAPVAVARAAGVMTARLDGSPLRYNQADPLLPDLLVCRSELVGAVRGALDRVGAH